MEELRSEHLKGNLAKLPIDVFSVVELELSLDVIPFDDLYEKYRIDAAIRSDFSGVYIDTNDFKLLDTDHDPNLNRLRFSIAHELGHMVLHREEFESNGFKTVSDFIAWTESLGGRNYNIEQEANEFAGRLLVPIERLAELFYDFSQKAEKTLTEDWRSQSGIRWSACELIAPRFGVSPYVIDVRFDREGIWPSSRE